MVLNLTVLNIFMLKKIIYQRLCPTKTIKVIFVDKLNCETFLKTGLKIDNLHYDPEPAKPNTQPVQCYKCCKFGHPAKYCKNVEICNKCSGSHAANICTSTDVKCINCDEQHMATSKQCKEYLRNKEKIKKTIFE
ncbi:unnamed protein product [Didymodactylos carnosus]|uniref:CCHC-type domain-containing protein n=1 Tax=Didymodactylos carnosus TaxID=1234261 RepID=A0A814YXQ2_9BILA|nr:unnamed protein product [Didymodactylos carnosus]CAF1234908.1 unnamed protein product [Didymodactylos carnosus]CAF3815589.1 unnamed protein product [Didymodactylos carnosus]CAF3997385.1 unnamed protein product [Didymodactylos carnosus]